MKEILRLCCVLTLIGAVCAAAMAFVDQKTREPIEEFHKAGKMEAAKALLPGFDNDPVKDAIVVREGPKDSTVFYRFTKGGKTIGAAFTVVAPSGYGGAIEILVAVDSAAVISGIEIISQQETPGLGSKITLPFFKDQFKGKSINDPPNWAVQKDGGTFRQVTGATLSSRAVTSAVAGGLEVLESYKAQVLGSGAAVPTKGAAAKRVPAKAAPAKAASEKAASPKRPPRTPAKEKGKK
jgi:Na+-translocating ferredoxin:NAD+ oxidoreductase subunit G